MNASNQRLDGRIAIVTGAASGIGRAIATLYAQHGCRVLAVDLPGQQLDVTYAAQRELAVLEIDITAEDAPGRITAAVEQRFGGLDILVNNAGISVSASFEETTDAIWERVFAVNVTSMMRISRAALPLLRKSTMPSVINLGSTMSEMAGPNLCAYGSSKHAVAGLSKAMACDLGKYGINVNYLQPGAIVTALSAPLFADPDFRRFWENKAPLGRLGQPEDVARVALFFASEDARFVSGAGLLVDGGARVNF
jgi:NAD(P)-dependent dehydrogenase (short-subunit alcohol dehydrogenase family)